MFYCLDDTILQLLTVNKDNNVAQNNATIHAIANGVDANSSENDTIASTKNDTDNAEKETSSSIIDWTQR